MKELSLGGMRVALTRDAAQCEQSAREVLQMGGVPCVFPLLHIALIADCTELSEALQALLAGDVVAFTSVNGVHFSVSVACSALFDAAARGVRFAAVGELTATALRVERLAEAPILPALKHTGAGLAEALLVATAPSQKVLVLGARQSRPELADALRAAGRTVQTLAIYQTQPGDASELWRAIDAAQVDAVVFASPSAVRAFANGRAVAHLSARVRIACIGCTTRDEARALGLRVDLVPKQPSMRSVLSALSAAM